MWKMSKSKLLLCVVLFHLAPKSSFSLHDDDAGGDGSTGRVGRRTTIRVRGGVGDIHQQLSNDDKIDDSKVLREYVNEDQHAASGGGAPVSMTTSIETSTRRHPARRRQERFLQATAKPTAAPTSKNPTASPTSKPTNTPTSTPTRNPTAVPTSKPSASPTTKAPTNNPTSKPTNLPSMSPTRVPTNEPTSKPTASPTTRAPTNEPTSKPTNLPSMSPTRVPTNEPTFKPTNVPSMSPTRVPTAVPTSKPTNVPSMSPTRAPTNEPTFKPTPSPTEFPTSTPTQSPVPPLDESVLTCPLPETRAIVITPGNKTITVASANTFCGIFRRTELGKLIPLARSYNGYNWEVAPGPLALPASNINSNNILLPNLPVDAPNDRYVILTKDGTSSVQKQIAKFLEQTTFGPKKSEIDALASDGLWSTNATEKRATHLRYQMDLPKSSHREYYRKRTNSKWDTTAQTARSDHPCSVNSRWRKYSYIPQDRRHSIDDTDIFTTFETVKAEVNYTTTLYEADSASNVKVGSGGIFWNSAPTSVTYGYSGTGYYDMGGTGDYLEFNVSIASAGQYPISFRYSQGSTSYNGNRKLQLQVNGVIVKSAYDFLYTRGWSNWMYTDLFDVTFNAGFNTIRVAVVDQNGGPNIDHLRIGKPPAVVMKTNGWPRVIARNGIQLLDDWPFTFTNTTRVYFTENPDAPQGDIFRYRVGRLRVMLPNGRSRYLDIGNPSINFTGYEQYLPSNVITFTGSEVWSETASDVLPYPLVRGQERILRSGISGAICDLIPPFAEEFDAPIFGRLPSGQWLQWTPSILLENNGPSINDVGDLSAKVLPDGGGSAFVTTGEKLKCSNVPRSFVNEDTCFLSTLSTACSATNLVSEVTMPLNTTVVRQLYALTGREVYAIQGLVMESISESPCAKTKSRWVVARNANCTAPSVLSATTLSALRGAITASSASANAFVTDVTRTLACSLSDYDQSSDPINIQLQVGENCYTHVHPNHLNLYDFTGWVTNHPGGAYNIEKWAQGWDGHEGWYLTFPFSGNSTRKIPQHPMNRWYTHGVEPNIAYVGRLGDEISFRDLPSELKTNAVAEYFGATPQSVIDGGVVVCGSIGEVSNDPTLPETFDVISNKVPTTSEDALNNQKAVIWTEIGLYGQDQLRQRMAWALAQIVTTVPANIDGYDTTEIYTHYYDIFVKHAFGNYRDILGEASYSPLMAEHLSYLKSKSHSYVYEFENKRNSRADENFAREVMQLFSIGLILLNDDGTPILDTDGNPIQTYTNNDIESFARAWTGFDRTAVRGNYEEDFTGTSSNRLDPMLVVSDYRDPFPKSNLNGGFIGDNYPLCVDLPSRSFLKKGASYRLLGGKSSPDLMKDPSYFANTAPGEILRAELKPPSQLYQRLYNSGNYELFVTLESDLICTPNTIECDVDTVRVVKVGSIYYEFVERPCVQLAFYDNGKQIQLRESYRRGQMCANPNLAHAREACCRSERDDEVNVAVSVSNVTYKYEGERMAFDTARDRCMSYGRDLCLFQGVTSVPKNDFWRKGYHWTNKDCRINVKVNSEGYIAIVHDVVSTEIDTIPWLVEEENTLNWFRVFWDGDGDFPGSSETNTCEANGCRRIADDNCLCRTIVTDSVVFTDLVLVTKDIVMSNLSIGALGPQDNSQVSDLGSGMKVHRIGGKTDENTVFEVQDKGRTLFLKNVRSTVKIEGWTMTPQIYEAEAAMFSNANVTNNTKCTGQQSVTAISGNETTFVQWNVNVPSAGTYLLSLRYAHDTSPRPLSVFVNTQEIKVQLSNPNVPKNFTNIAVNPTAAQLPLQRCVSDCDSNSDCSQGLFCMQNNGLERVPGCVGVQNSWDYCVDINDFDYGFTLLPTGSTENTFHMSKPLAVVLLQGQNTIRVQLPPKYTAGPNIDHLKVEGLVKSSLSSFRNPPHFMSLTPDYSSGRIGERNLRDAQYETDAVLDHYFYQNNVAPFLCVRIMQRFSFSNPSPRFVASCVKAFRTGFYNSGSASFGSGKYGSLEAVAAAILLDREATDGAVSVDPSYGSIREPILRFMNLMRSMDYQTSIPTPADGTALQTTYSVKLWEIDEKLGQGPYEFPTVFSFFLPEYVPDAKLKLTSPEAVVTTMPNILNLLDGMFSLIKYGLSDCNNGFSLFPGYGNCIDDGSFQRSFGRLFYAPTGVNDYERASDLALLLTAGRLSNENLIAIVAACSSEPDQGSKDRCMTQLIVSTGEFHSTNHVKRSGGGRVTEAVPANSTEPYKAIVYFYLNGGLDSYHMLMPHTCAPIDVYDRYRTVRGKSDVAEGIGLPLSRLLQIQANNANQPCSSFGVHENLTEVKSLYDQNDLLFIANAGLLAKPVTRSNYEGETPVQLFAHNAMAYDTGRVDLFKEFAGTGVGGRIADVLTQGGVPTNLFSISGQQVALVGQTGKSSPQFILSSSGLTAFNANPSITNMNEVIKAINNGTTADSGVHAETWSSKLTESLERQRSLKENVDQTNVTTVFPTDDIANQLKLVTRLMQTRVARGVKRDIFYVQDGGYDTHALVDESLIINFGRINGAVKAFVNELKVLGLWNSTVVVQFSEFARTLDPNTGDGSDHGWGGNHFMFGGAVKGGKVLGRYPSDFNEGDADNLALSRGRMIPSSPWDAMWLGTAEWFGVSQANMDVVLPMHKNFPAGVLYDKAALFDEPEQSLFV